MKISKKSFTYKLNKQFNTIAYRELEKSNEVSLCKYFWGSCFAYILALGVVLMGILTVGIGILALFGVLCALIFLTAPYTGYFGSEFVAKTGVNAVLVLCVLILSGGVVRWSEGDTKFAPDWMTNRLKLRVKLEKPKKHSLIKDYYNAHKNKFCPIVELED